MNSMSAILPYAQIALSVLLITVILLQKGDAELGNTFGGGDSFGSGYHTRRGFEKVVFNATIVLGVLFIVTSFLHLIIK